MSVTNVESFEGWAIVELMGHRKLAGKVTEQTVAGSALMRLDIYVGDQATALATQLYNPSALYCLTPTTEEICRAFAKRAVPEPVTRWELPASPAPVLSQMSAGDDSPRAFEDGDDVDDDERLPL